MTCANHPDRPNTAFCQHCGKPICADCTRNIGSAIFCEPCLADRAGVNRKPGAAPVPPVGQPIGQPIDTGEPNPATAALLGFIPGVGAMYNGQYGKGLVHLIVFALLVMLSHQVGIFGLFVAGWIFYMVIEAHHTARARRDGTPLPNPFGLNEFGERIGYGGQSWPPADVPPPTSTPNEPIQNPNMPPYNYEYRYQYPPAPPIPPMPSDEEVAAWQRNRFPAGAAFLILLGVIFLLNNLHVFPHNSAREILPMLLIGFGIWSFMRRLSFTDLAGSQIDPATRRIQVLHSAQGSLWMVLIGSLWLMDSFDLVRWHRSWPLLLIAIGGFALLRRGIYAGLPPAYPPPPQAQPAQPAESTTTAIVPAPHHPDQEL